MPSFKEIPDLMIQAFAPVTGRFMTRYARNHRAINVLAIDLHASQSPALPTPYQGTLSSNSVPFVTVFTLRVFCPFAGSVTISLPCLLFKDPDDGPAAGRLEEDATGGLSGVISISANTDSGDAVLAVGFIAVADTIRLINFQCTLNSISPVGVTMQAAGSVAAGGSYMAARP